VRLIVDFAHTLGLRITAEGVENERQAKSLVDINCGMAQGFYFSIPLRSEAAGSS
jgi:ammonium transporter, Amt family